MLCEGNSEIFISRLSVIKFTCLQTNMKIRRDAVTTAGEVAF